MSRILLSFLVLGVAAVLAVAWYIGWGDSQNQETMPVTVNVPENTGQPSSNAAPDGLSGLDPDTKTYVSNLLGIRFRYDSKPIETMEIKVTEQGNKIYVHGTKETPEQGKIIEVFTKPANVTLTQAVKERFLRGYPEKDCFVTIVPEQDSPPGYTVAIIDYPAPTTEGAPFWENASKCPEYYAKTNAVQYFLLNNSVPTKYVFLKLGQDSITSDGTPVTEQGGRDWSASIEIFK
jgi:hypothetical protein